MNKKIDDMGRSFDQLRVSLKDETNLRQNGEKKAYFVKLNKI